MLGLITFLSCLLVSIPIVIVAHKKDWNSWKLMCWLIMADVAVFIVATLAYAWFFR